MQLVVGRAGTQQDLAQDGHMQACVQPSWGTLAQPSPQGISMVLGLTFGLELSSVSFSFPPSLLPSLSPSFSLAWHSLCNSFMQFRADPKQPSCSGDEAPVRLVEMSALLEMYQQKSWGSSVCGAASEAVARLGFRGEGGCAGLGI